MRATMRRAPRSKDLHRVLPHARRDRWMELNDARTPQHRNRGIAFEGEPFEKASRRSSSKASTALNHAVSNVNFDQRPIYFQINVITVNHRLDVICLVSLVFRAVFQVRYKIEPFYDL